MIYTTELIQMEKMKRVCAELFPVPLSLPSVLNTTAFVAVIWCAVFLSPFPGCTLSANTARHYIFVHSQKEKWSLTLLIFYLNCSVGRTWRCTYLWCALHKCNCDKLGVCGVYTTNMCFSFLHLRPVLRQFTTMFSASFTFFYLLLPYWLPFR